MKLYVIDEPLPTKSRIETTHRELEDLDENISRRGSIWRAHL